MCFRSFSFAIYSFFLLLFVSFFLSTYTRTVLFTPDWIVNCFGFCYVKHLVMYRYAHTRTHENVIKWQTSASFFAVVAVNIWFFSFSVWVIFLFRLMYLMKAIYTHPNSVYHKTCTEKGVLVYSLQVKVIAVYIYFMRLYWLNLTYQFFNRI